MSKELELELEARVSENLEAMRAFKYNPQYFKNMLSEVGAKRAIGELLSKPKASDGLTTLWDNGRMDLSMEALIIDNEKFHHLFKDEQLANARKWLKGYGYEFKS